ncbi:MAG: sigma-70 family RNA polymerase sigma factor [Nodosilinea sp.]
MFSTWSTSPRISTQDGSTQLTNAELVVLCQQRSQPEGMIFAELLRRYQGHVDKLLYHLAPEWSDRSDLAQEVWIRVYRNIKRLQEPSRFKGWLGRITTNLFYDELRRRRSSSLVSLDAPRAVEDGTMDWELPTPVPGPVDSLMTQEFYHHFRKAIAELPEVFRTAIILREVEGLSYEEIATHTGVTLGTVKSRIARARQRLQSQLLPYLGR